MEDYTVVYLGAALFKILRLLLVGAFSVHFFACVFYRVKIVSAESSDEVSLFYSSRKVQEDVKFLPLNDWFQMRSYKPEKWLWICCQDLMNQYVGCNFFFQSQQFHSISKMAFQTWIIIFDWTVFWLVFFCLPACMLLLCAYYFHHCRLW